MGYSQAVRQQTLTLSLRWFESSYPSQNDSLAQLVEHLTFNQRVRRSNRLRVTKGPGGETGRRTGLKILRTFKIRAGSIPALGTI